ncbi:MAG: hypothetical protein ACI3XG_09825 [Faecousia sp.]
MDYLYINSIIREVYKDIPCGCSFPAAIRQKMQRYFANDDFLQSSVENNLSCFTLRADDERSAPVLVLMNAARQHSSKSVGRYTQCIGWVWNSSLLNDGYDAVLNTGFYSEEEILNAAAGQTSVPFPNKSAAFEPMDIEIAPDTMRAVLTALVLRWTKCDAILRIAVPREADYNRYVVSAVRKLYSYMPYALRMQAGFTSYLSNPSRELPQISIGFIPEALADNNTMFLNGSSVAVINKLLQEGTHRKSLDSFLTYLCHLEEASRKEYLRLVNMEAEQNADGKDDGRKLARVTAKDYSVLGECLELQFMQGSLDEKIPAWRQFFRNAGKYPPISRERIEQQIAKELDPETFAGYYSRQCTQDAAQIYSEYKSMAGFCGKFPALKDRLWEAFLSQMRQSGASYREILELVSANSRENEILVSPDKKQLLQLFVLEESLSRLVSSVDPEKSDRAAVRSELQTITKGIQPHLTSTNPAEAEKARQLKEALEHFVNRLNQAWANQLLQEKTAEFQKIKALPTDSVKSLDESIRLAVEFAKAIENQPVLNSLRQEIIAFVEERQGMRNASNTKFNELQRKAAASKSYFDLCGVLFDPDYVGLEQKQRELFSKEIRRRKPATYPEYASAFEIRFRQKLNAVSLAGLSGNLCKKIVEDLSQFPEISIPLPATGQDIRGVVEGMSIAASGVFPNASIAVQLGKDAYPCKQLQQVLSFEPAVFQGENAGSAIELLLSFASHGTLTGRDMLPCVKVLPREGELPRQVLERLVLPGCFRGADSRQYTAVYQYLFRVFSAKAGDAEASAILNQALASAQTGPNRPDALAADTLEAFLKTGGSGKKPSSRLILIIVAIIAALLVLIGSGTAAYFLLKPSSEAVVPVQSQALSIPEQLFGTADSPKSFEDHIAAAGKILEQAENDAVHNAMTLCYNTPQPDALIGNATWEEYFFWACFVHSGDSAGSIIPAFDARTPDMTVVEILRLLHGEDLESSQVQDDAAASTQDSQDAESALDGGTVTDAPAAAPTLEEILQTSAQAAKDAFERTAAAYRP